MLMDDDKSDLSKVAPPKDLDERGRIAFFKHFTRRIAAHRNTFELYAQTEYLQSSLPDSVKAKLREAYTNEIGKWAQQLLRNAWTACQEPEGAECPALDPLSDTSTAGLPALPTQKSVSQLLNTILFLHVTTNQQYQAHTRVFLRSFGSLDEDAIVQTLKNPDHALKQAEKKIRTAKEEHAENGRTLRRVGMGLGAVAGGVLVGVTGGLAAPLVGAGVTTVLGWLGVGGTAAGLLASGLASSSVVCGALFGVYGSKKSSEIVERYIREVRDLAILPTHEPQETLAVRLCVSGWLASPDDVTAPWTIFGGNDTFALRWEVDALMQLSNALIALVKFQAMKYVKAEIIKRTVFASLFAALSPTAWLKIAQIIDNPWMNAKSLATKTGKVLGTLLAHRVLGNRPISLVGYSLGSLVIFEALQHLASLPPSETSHLIQDVYLFGSPIPTDSKTWSSIRRLVSGRLVNGYGKDDYILAILCRVSNVSWSVAGLTKVEVQGVENVQCDGVDGHLKWRGMIGHYLEVCGAEGVVKSEVELQLEKKAKKIEEMLDMSANDAQTVLEGPDVPQTTEAVSL